MATGTANFPNRPFRVRIEVWYNWQSGRTASQHTEVWIDKLSPSPSWSGCCSSFEVYVDSVGLVQSWSGGFDFRSGDNFLIHASDRTVTTNTSGDSGAQVYANYDILGYAQAGATYDGVTPSPPSAPAQPTVVSGSTTTTGFTVQWNAPSNNGTAIDGYEVQFATNVGFTGATTQTSSDLTEAITGRPPGTDHYVRVRAHSAIGWGPYSSVLTAATLPATAPGLSVAPALNGQSSVLTLTPPGGSTGVTEYNIEFRPSGGSTTAYAQPGTTKTFTGLTPGGIYEYRANAEFGAYTSPWTSWTPVSQPSPNTNPGNYFDGDTVDAAGLEYAWQSTAGASKSEALAYGVNGWDAVFSAPTAGMLYQVADGIVSDSAARVMFTKDASAAGQWHAGQSLVTDSWAEVTADTVYGFSIYVNPSRSQRLAARSSFWNGTAEFGATLGTAVVCPANEWTRLFVVTTAPTLATRAVVRVADVAGTGFSVMLGGQSILLDGAMVSLGATIPEYFDGATPDTTEFVYSWLGLPFFSASTKSVNTTTYVDPLADPDCVPLPEPPRPPAIPSDCIEDIGSWRRYIVQVASNEVPLFGATLPTLVLSTGAVAERQVRIRIFPNPDGVAPELLDLTTWQAELILTFIPPNTDITLDGVTRRVWAGVDGADPIAADRLLYGTGGVPATWPELICGVGYVITLDVPIDAPAGNLGTKLFLTQRV